MKQRIRLTESSLHRIINESVRRILVENPENFQMFKQEFENSIQPLYTNLGNTISALDAALETREQEYGEKPEKLVEMLNTAMTLYKQLSIFMKSKRNYELKQGIRR